MTQKRGRLSTIDLLPEEAWPHIREALDKLSQRHEPQEQIRNELNTHLLSLGFAPISRSSFNRKALSLAKIGADIAQAREMAAIFAEKLDDMPEGDVGMLINEMVKTLIYNMTANLSMADSELTAKMAKDISMTLYRLEQAGNISVKRRREIEARSLARASEAVETVARAQGLSAETIEAIKANVLGIVRE